MTPLPSRTIGDSYSREELDGFRRLQRLAYDAVVEVAERVVPGVTEREAARALEEALGARGIRSYFHQPFAWFGGRSRFSRFRTPLDFFPTSRAAEPGMAAILDVAPVQDGCAVDVGYAFSVGESPEVATALGDLEPFRREILNAVLAEAPLRDIYARVDLLAKELGYENCHQQYPFGVLGHKVERTADRGFQRRRLFGFGLASGSRLLAQAARARLFPARWSTPLWNARAAKGLRASPGLWAMEPHLGRGDIGVKWEELLVVTPTTAYWLDDDLPHVRRWERKATHARSAPHG